MENENENLNSQNETEATENATEEKVESTESEGNEINLESEVKKATAPLYARMKQAEAEAKELKARLSKVDFKDTSIKTVVAGELTTKDIYALIDAKVPQEDIEDVREYALLKKIPIADALRAPLIKSILSDKAEQRKTAMAANTGTSKRGSGKMTDEAILENARMGKDTDPEALAKARIAERMRK